MDYDMNIVNIELSYWTKKDGGLDAIKINIPPEMIRMNLQNECSVIDIYHGSLIKRTEFKKVKVDIVKEKESNIYCTVKETLGVINDFLYNDKWDHVVVSVEFAGKHAIYNDHGLQDHILFGFERKDLEILEVSEQDKREGVKFSFVFNK